MSKTLIWDAAFNTAREHTKPFTKSGGFSGTAIKPIYLVREATKLFGPAGIGWGWHELEHQLIEGIWCSKVELWFEHDGKRGTIQQWGATTMVGSNSKGPFVDEEAPKKSLTDALVKCLSYLGFGGDVHMGLFDDSKYVPKASPPSRVSAATLQTLIASLPGSGMTELDLCLKLYVAALADLPETKALATISRLNAIKQQQQQQQQQPAQ